MKAQIINEQTRQDLRESEELIYQVLEHINAGRFNEDLIKQKLIQAAKNLPIVPSLKMSKFN